MAALKHTSARRSTRSIIPEGLFVRTAFEFTATAGPAVSTGARSLGPSRQMARLLIALCAAASAVAIARAQTFVNVPTNGLERGWQFVAYEFDRNNNFAEKPGTRRTGVIADSLRFFVRRGQPPAIYGLGTASDYIKIQWTGFLRIVVAGTYRFKLGSDDGSFLYIDGREVSKCASIRAPGTANATVVTLARSARRLPSWCGLEGVEQALAVPMAAQETNRSRIPNFVPPCA